MRRSVLFVVLVFVARIAQSAECASPLLDAHIAGIRTFLEGYTPGFSAGPGIPVADFASWTKTLSSAQAQALKKDEYTVVKGVVLDSTKANHLRDYMLEAGATNIPWWVTLPTNVIPSAWVGVAFDALAAALDGAGASAHQSLTEAAGTVAAGGRVQILERVVQDGSDLLFVSVTAYQAKVANEYRTTVLQRCTGRVRVAD